LDNNTYIPSEYVNIQETHFKDTRI